MQVLYLGRAPCTKETLPDFLKWRRVTRHPLVFRGLTGSQRTPGFWGRKYLFIYFFPLIPAVNAPTRILVPEGQLEHGFMSLKDIEHWYP